MSRQLLNLRTTIGRNYDKQIQVERSYMTTHSGKSLHDSRGLGENLFSLLYILAQARPESRPVPWFWLQTLATISIAPLAPLRPTSRFGSSSSKFLAFCLRPLNISRYYMKVAAACGYSRTLSKLKLNDNVPEDYEAARPLLAALGSQG